MNNATSMALFGSVCVIADITEVPSDLFFPKNQKKKKLNKMTLDIGITKLISLGFKIGSATSIFILILLFRVESAYFKHANKWTFKTLDSFVRRRLRAILLKQQNRHGCGNSTATSFRWKNAYFAERGLFSLHEAHVNLASQSRCGNS